MAVPSRILVFSGSRCGAGKKIEVLKLNGNIANNIFWLGTFLLLQYGEVLFKGACVTLLLAIVGTFIGCVIGLVVGIVETIPEDKDASFFSRALLKTEKRILDAYVEISVVHL